MWAQEEDMDIVDVDGAGDADVREAVGVVVRI